MASDGDSGWGKMASSGLELAAGIGLGVAVGYWVDHKRNTGPWGVLVGFFVGFIAGMYLLVKDALKSDKKPDRKQPGGNQPGEKQSDDQHSQKD